MDLATPDQRVQATPDQRVQATPDQMVQAKLDQMVQAKLDQMVQALPFVLGRYALIPLTGDASSRRYHRLQGLDSPRRSAILMSFDPHAPLASEEKTTSGKTPTELLFYNVQRFLHPLGLPIPAIYAYARDAGMLLLEDFGDQTLEAWQQDRAPAERREMYRQAVQVLVDLQLKATGALGAECWAAYEAFDPALLRWEFDHFYEYALAHRFGPLDPAAYAVVDSAFAELSTQLARLPRVFVHRDYHSRNLMVFQGSIKIIDFQDALLGPQHYDLASLLRDAYVTLPESDVEALIDHYLSCYRQGGGTGQELEPERFRLDFDLVTLHRCMKAAGRFEFIDAVKKNPRFLQYVPGAMTQVRRVLLRHPSLAPLHEALASRVPALRA